MRFDKNPHVGPQRVEVVLGLFGSMIVFEPGFEAVVGAATGVVAVFEAMLEEELEGFVCSLLSIG